MKRILKGKSENVEGSVENEGGVSVKNLPKSEHDVVPHDVWVKIGKVESEDSTFEKKLVDEISTVVKQKDHETSTHVAEIKKEITQVKTQLKSISQHINDTRTVVLAKNVESTNQTKQEISKKTDEVVKTFTDSRPSLSDLKQVVCEKDEIAAANVYKITTKLEEFQRDLQSSLNVLSSKIGFLENNISKIEEQNVHFNNNLNANAASITSLTALLVKVEKKLTKIVGASGTANT